MSLDRFIHWPDKSKAPKRDDIDLLCQNYIGTVPHMYLRIEEDRTFIFLGGRCSAALAFQKEVAPGYQAAAEENRRNPQNAQQRFIEVIVDDDDATIDVITRQHDEFTNAVAVGLVEIITRFWQGKPGLPGDDAE